MISEDQGNSTENWHAFRDRISHTLPVITDLRISFETRFSKDSGLRRLARRIATLDGSAAQKIGLFDLEGSVAYPANFLVNGSDEAFTPVSTTFQEPDCSNLYDLALWKFGNDMAINSKSSRYGFNNTFKGSKGLSLLFDPLIDSFIALSRTAPIRNSFVIVLTDFYPFFLCCSDMVTGMDWGSEQTSKYLNGSAKDDSLRPVVSALSEIFPQQGRENCLEEIRRSRSVHLEFLPFFPWGSCALRRNRSSKNR